MNNPELYHTSNILQKTDARQCLEEYGKKITWGNFDTVIDIGCADGGVTSILKSFMPYDCKELEGCDISENMVQFANAHYARNNVKFMVLDIESDLPDQLIEKYNQAFSFYTLHLIRHQEIAFSNIYDLLVKGGACLLMFPGLMPVFDIWRKLSRAPRWRYLLKDVDRFVSPYHDCQEPEKGIKRMMSSIGFTNIEVKCLQKEFVFTAFRDAMSGINPFKIPLEMLDDFFEDTVKVVHDMKLVDHSNNNLDGTFKVKMNYELIVAYGLPIESIAMMLVGREAVITIKKYPAEFVLCFFSDHSSFGTLCLYFKLEDVFIEGLISLRVSRSQASLATIKSETQCKEEVYVPPLDVFTVKVKDIRIPDEESRSYTIKITYFDQLLCSSVVITTGGRDDNVGLKKPVARGFMNYDPSDYEKMCLFADNPLIIQICPCKSMESLYSGGHGSTIQSQSQSTKSASITYNKDLDTYSCNIDILPIFIDTNKMHFKKRMEPIVAPSVLLAKSWDNLPLIMVTVKAKRNNENYKHHKILQEANFMKLTLVGSYNMIIPYEEEFSYTAATKLPLENEMGNDIMIFGQGFQSSKGFNSLSFYPQWESLRLRDNIFAKGDMLFQYNIDELQNEEKIDFEYYDNKTPKAFTTIWASFHRTLLFKDKEKSLSDHLLRYNWPLEVHVSEGNCGYSFMAFLDLFKLLYPGENQVRLLVPLRWADVDTMALKCGCEPLLPPNERVPSGVASVQKSSKVTTDSVPVSTNTDLTLLPRPTGGDGNSAFIVVEVTLARPFKDPVIPPHITESEIHDMLMEMEVVVKKRFCSGRGQGEDAWRDVVRVAASALAHFPYYGMTDICTINRQLSETRTRVELVTSLFQEAAIFVNNNFVVKEFLQSEDSYQEMLMIAHACLMRITNDTLVSSDKRQEPYSTLKAARHARQLQDLPHAMDLYLQLIVEGSRKEDSWRELATCLLDLDRDWAKVCINKSIMLNHRHPLSLLSKGCMVFEDDPNAAEPFFVALLAFYPFWMPLWVAASVYYVHRELFHMAQAIMEQVKKTEAEGLSEEMKFPRVWGYELGDWWDETPRMPGTSIYYDAADLLLRLRGIELAEICIARALLENGESAVYFHMVALCCRLKGKFDDALCHIHQGIGKYGEISYLRSLEGECYHKKKEFDTSMASFDKVGNCRSAYITLLSLPRRDPVRSLSILTDLVRRHPSAYAWMAFADHWMMRVPAGESGDAGSTLETRTCIASARECALSALQFDRRAARAYALLAARLMPSARRQYCKEIAILCGYTKHIEEGSKHGRSGSQQSICFSIGRVLRECRCNMCEHLIF